jgi:hypothetical protein
MLGEGFPSDVAASVIDCRSAALAPLSDRLASQLRRALGCAFRFNSNQAGFLECDRGASGASSRAQFNRARDTPRIMPPGRLSVTPAETGNSCLLIAATQQ